MSGDTKLHLHNITPMATVNYSSETWIFNQKKIQKSEVIKMCFFETSTRLHQIRPPKKFWHQRKIESYKYSWQDTRISARVQKSCGKNRKNYLCNWDSITEQRDANSWDHHTMIDYKIILGFMEHLNDLILQDDDTLHFKKNFRDW